LANFIGHWKENKAEGFGEFRRQNGAVFEGNWKEDKQHGSGKETWPNGIVYIGDYYEGFKDGIGKLTFPDKSRYMVKHPKNLIKKNSKNPYTKLQPQKTSTIFPLKNLKKSKFPKKI